MMGNNKLPPVIRRCRRGRSWFLSALLSLRFCFLILILSPFSYSACLVELLSFFFPLCVVILPVDGVKLVTGQPGKNFFHAYLSLNDQGHPIEP